MVGGGEEHLLGRENVLSSNLTSCLPHPPGASPLPTCQNQPDRSEWRWADTSALGSLNLVVPGARSPFCRGDGT